MYIYGSSEKKLTTKQKENRETFAKGRYYNLNGTRKLASLLMVLWKGGERGAHPNPNTS